MDKFVNATRLIGVLDSAIARPSARGNAKSIDDMWCDMAMQYTKCILEEEISAGGEFRRVVHAHWIEHYEDFGESFLLNARLVILEKMSMNQSFVLTVELLWTRRLSDGESSFTSWVWTFI